MVVRRRDHDAEVSLNVVDKKRCCRGGQNSGIENINAGTCQPGRNRRRQEFARDSRITRNNRARLTPLSTHLVGVSTLCENLGGCLRKTQGQVGREFGVGEPANTIGPKETRHRRMTD